MGEQPNQEQLTTAFKAAELPAPVAIQRLGNGIRHDVWRVSFDRASGLRPVLLRQVPSGAGEGLRAELAALKLLGGQDELPVVGRYQLLQGLGRPTAVSAILPGSTGEVWIERGHGEPVIRTVGEVLGILADHPMHRFGDRVLDTDFLPTRSSWRSAWMARVARFSGKVIAGGIDLGPLQHALFMAIEQRLSALDEVSEFGLVHGDLQPGNLLFRLGPDGLALSGVIDWEFAMVGDPLADWARSMLVPADTLRGVIDGYGKERAATLFAGPGAVQRLELYWLTQLLERLAVCAGSLGSRPGLRGRALAHAQAMIRAFFDEGGARPRLDHALADGDVTVLGVPSADALNAGRHHLADAMVRGAVVGVKSAWLWSGAVQALVLAQRVPIARMDWIGAAAERSDQLLPLAPSSGEPIADRAAWLSATVERVVALQYEQGGAGTGLITLASGLALVEGLGHHVGDGFLRQLQASAEALATQDGRWMGGGMKSPQVRLAHALMGLAALAYLTKHVQECPGAADLEKGLRLLMNQALEQVDAPVASGDLLDLLEMGPPAMPGTDDPPLAPVLCAAMLQLDEGASLPIGAPTMALALGIVRA